MALMASWPHGPSGFTHLGLPTQRVEPTRLPQARFKQQHGLNRALLRTEQQPENPAARGPVPLHPLHPLHPLQPEHPAARGPVPTATTPSAATVHLI